MQDDKNLVFDGFDTLKDTLIMTNEIIKNTKPNKRMLEMANTGYTTATDFADYLANIKKVLSEAYKISSKVVNFAEKNKKNFKSIKFERVKKILQILNIGVLKVLM